MLPSTIATYALLGTGLTFSIIELGLGAYAVSLFDKSYDCITGVNTLGEYTYGTCKTSVPAVVSFLVFASVWSILTTPFALLYPFLQVRKANGSHEALNQWLAPLFIGLFFLTFVFWLAAFADLANIFGGYIEFAGGVSQAALAFGVLNWLVYMALFILTIITVVGVMSHDLPGFQPLSSRNVEGGGPAQGNAVAMTEDHHIINEEPKNDAVPEMVA